MKKNNRRIWKNLTDKHIIEYVTENYKGEGVSLRGNDRYLSKILCKRKLIDILTNKGILIRERKEKNLYKNISTKKLVYIVARDYKGKTIDYFSRSNQVLYSIIRKRELIDKLVEKEILIRKHKANYFFKRMSNKDLILYIKKNHKGKIISEFMKEDLAAYQHANKRGLIDKIIEDNIIITRINRHFLNMGNKELISYINKNCKGKTLSQFQKVDSALYAHVRKRGILDSIVKKGIITRDRRPRGLLKDLRYMLEQSKEIMKKERFEDFPSMIRLQNLGYWSIVNVIIKYHVCFPAFREKLNEYLGRPFENLQLESLLETYVRGNSHE